MSMQWVRDNYGVPVKRHGLVRQTDGVLKGVTLVVRSCSRHVHASRPEGGYVYRFHPMNLEYKTDDGWVRAKP